MPKPIKFKDESEANKPRGERTIVLSREDVEMTIEEIERAIVAQKAATFRAQEVLDIQTSKLAELEADLVAADALAL